VFVGGLAGQHLARIRFDENRRKVEEEKLLEGIGRVRDVRSGRTATSTCSSTLRMRRSCASSRQADRPFAPVNPPFARP
jgi:hypothetical protein